MKIRGFDTDRQVLIVAEIGNNHEGNVEVAAELVRQAAQAGADAVKFQTFRTEHYVTANDAARFARLKSFELSYPQFERLAVEARSLGLLFFSTPFDIESARFLDTIVDCFKVSSGDIDFYPMIRQIAGSDRPVIFSTGASDFELLRRALVVVEDVRGPERTRNSVAVLHCVSAYPTPPLEANLRSIRYLADRTGLTVGYSDHTIGTTACLGATVLGARILEKHFTLDHHYSDFRDHQLSADPGEFSSLVKEVRALSQMLGSEEKAVRNCETATVPVIRRSIVAARDLAAGSVIGEADLTWVRPAGGLAPGREAELLGRRLRLSIVRGTRLSLADID